MKKYDIIFIIFLLILPVLLIAQVEVLIIDNPHSLNPEAAHR